MKWFSFVYTLYFGHLFSRPPVCECIVYATVDGWHSTRVLYVRMDVCVSVYMARCYMYVCLIIHYGASTVNGTGDMGTQVSDGCVRKCKTC